LFVTGSYVTRPESHDPTPSRHRPSFSRRDSSSQGRVVKQQALETEVVFRANRAWWRIPVKEIWDYRDLVSLMVRRDFTAVYKQSILGPLWYVIQPMVTTLTFTVVFGQLARIGTDGVPPFLFYFSGIMLWTYFQACLNTVSTSLMDNAHVFGKVYFPRLVVPLALVITNLGQLAINLVLYIGFWIYYAWFTPVSFQVGWSLFALPVLVVQTALVGLGSGLWLAALTAKYRDLRFALGFLSQIWMFVTPIVYPTSVVMDRHLWILALNPMAGVVDYTRHILLGTPAVDPVVGAIGALVGLFIFFSGLLYFNKVQRAFVDTI
jgi:lipopolysaccharide transport system permease protein